MKRTWRWLALGLSLAAGFTVSSAQNNLSFSGTVYALPGSNVQNTVVVACLLVNDTCDDNRSGVQQLSATGSSARFQIANLQNEDYLLLAWRDLNGNSEADAGDEVGVYQQRGKPALVRPPAANLELRLSKFTGDLDSLINQAEQPVPAAPPPVSVTPPAAPPASSNPGPNNPGSSGTNISGLPIRFTVSGAWRDLGGGSFEATFGKPDPNSPQGTINLEVLPARAKQGALLAQTRAIWQAETKGQLDQNGKTGGLFARRLPSGLNVGVTFGTLRRMDNPNRTNSNADWIFGVYSVMYVVEVGNQVVPIFFLMRRPDASYAYATTETEGRSLMLEFMNTVKSVSNVSVPPLYTEANFLGKWKETSSTYNSADYYNPSTGAYVSSAWSASAFTLRLSFDKNGAGFYDASFVQATNAGTNTLKEKTASKWRIAGDQIIIERPATGRKSVYQLYGIGKDDRGQPVILTRYLLASQARDDLDGGSDTLWVVDK